MNGRTEPSDAPKPIRLVFELARADNPRLYDELQKFQQGAKRVNRLRVLAYDGLLVQHGVFGLIEGGRRLAYFQTSRVATTATAVTNGIFEPGSLD